MSFHPNPINLVVHVEHHRQELIDQARRERLAQEAIAGAPAHRRGWTGVRIPVAGVIRAIAARWQRPAMVDALELPQSTPGEAV